MFDPDTAVSRSAAPDLSVHFHAPGSHHPAPRLLGTPTAARSVSRPDVSRLVLLDVENQSARGGANSLAEVVDLVRAHLGDDALLVAAVASRNHPAFASACEDLGIAVMVCDDSSSAADRALLSAGRLARTFDPDVELAVASGDHAFACLAPDVVISRNPDGVSARLAEAAGELILSGDPSRPYRKPARPRGDGPTPQVDAPLFENDEPPRALVVINVRGDRFDPGALVAAALKARTRLNGTPAQLVVTVGGPHAGDYAALARHLGAEMLVAADGPAARQAATVLAQVASWAGSGVEVLTFDAVAPRCFADEVAEACPTARVSRLRTQPVASADPLLEATEQWWQSHGPERVGPRWVSLRNRSRKRLELAWAGAAA